MREGFEAVGIAFRGLRQGLESGGYPLFLPLVSFFIPFLLNGGGVVGDAVFG
jgi:hypothetical protein